MQGTTKTRRDFLLCYLRWTEGRRLILLNQTTGDRHTDLVTLSEAKGLTVRFFAEFILSEVEGLRMTVMSGRGVKHTNVMCFDLGNRRFPCPGEPEGVKRQHVLSKLWL